MRRDDAEAVSASVRLEADDWADILGRWARMLDHMPTDVQRAPAVQGAAKAVACRLPAPPERNSDV